MIGARKARPGWIHRLLARAVARELHAFIVPGMDVARAGGIDLDAAGLTPVDSPRRANVLVLLAPIPDALVEPAVVVWAQMPRPRALLVIGDDRIPDLPEPDVQVGLDQEDLSAGVDRLRTIIADGAWQSDVHPYQHDLLSPADEQDDAAMSHHHHHHGGDGDHNGNQHDHEAHAHQEEDDHGEHGTHVGDADAGGHAEHGSGHQDTGHQDHSGHGDHEGHMMDHGDHGGHGDGFMSMIAMTKDLPRSPDELQMDWIEAPFGPLHPGLPSGLMLKLTLDGDRIADATVDTGVTRDHLGLDLPTAFDRFQAALHSLDRLAPGAYRILAGAALAGHRQAGWEAPRIVELERIRVQSHLNWLASFAHLLGFEWLARRSSRLLRQGVDTLKPGDLDAIDRTCRSYLMRRRLSGVGQLDPDAHQDAVGPVARAMRLEHDARCDDPAYHAIGFEPVLRDEGDAYARLLVRVGEIRQSLELIASSAKLDTLPNPGGVGIGIEAPRGRATLHATVNGNEVTDFRMETPSTRHISLVAGICQGHELSAGLIAIASLDLSPWEVES